MKFLISRSMKRKLKEIEMQIKLVSSFNLLLRIPLNQFEIEQILEEVWKVKYQILKLSLSYLHVGEFRLNYIRF